MLGCRSRRAHGLLFPYLVQRQPCADSNHIKDRVRRIGRQAQHVEPLPRTNANIGRIRIGALFDELTPPLFLTLIVFLRKAPDGRLNELMCGR